MCIKYICQSFSCKTWPSILCLFSFSSLCVITAPLFFFPLWAPTLVFSVGTWAASFQAWGTAARLSPALWVYKQTQRCAHMGTKGRLMGEARRSQVDQGAMWERWNLPTILLRPPPGREMSDLQDWVFSWETEALTRSHAARTFVYTFSGKVLMVAKDMVPFLRKRADGFHTEAHSNSYSHTFHQRFG